MSLTVKVSTLEEVNLWMNLIKIVGKTFPEVQLSILIGLTPAGSFLGAQALRAIRFSVEVLQKSECSHIFP